MNEDKKLVWSLEVNIKKTQEDEQLREMYETLGPKWENIASQLNRALPLQRLKDAKQCRER